MVSAKWGLTEMIEAQNGAHLVHNEAVALLEALSPCEFESGYFNTNTPPVSPTNGHTSFVGSAPTGVWSGSSGKIAVFLNGTYWYFTPRNMVAYDKGAKEFLCWSTTEGEWYPRQLRWTTTEYWTGAYRYPIGNPAGTQKKLYARLLEYANISAPFAFDSLSGIDLTYPVQFHGTPFFVDSVVAGGVGYSLGVSAQLGYPTLHASLSTSGVAIEASFGFGAGILDADILILYCKQGP